MTSNPSEIVVNQPEPAQTSSQEPEVSPKALAPSSSHSCKCLKSRCLRLNCSCFSTMGYCGDGCLCAGCLNVPFHDDERNFVIEKTLAINRLAFKPKLRLFTMSVQNIDLELQNSEHLSNNVEEETRTRLNTGSEADLNLSSPVQIYSRGCKCCKSHCQSKHCECFKNGLKCTNICKCDHCVNGFLELDKRDIGKYYEKEHRKRFKLVIPKRMPKTLKNSQPEDESIIKFVKFK